MEPCNSQYETHGALLSCEGHPVTGMPTMHRCGAISWHSSQAYQPTTPADSSVKALFTLAEAAEILKQRRAKRRARRFRNETSEYLAAARRFIRGAGRRCADGDEVELGELIALCTVLAEAEATAVAGLRARGESWAYIATATGTSREAAFQKWGRK